MFCSRQSVGRRDASPARSRTMLVSTTLSEVVKTGLTNIGEVARDDYLTGSLPFGRDDTTLWRIASPTLSGAVLGKLGCPTVDNAMIEPRLLSAPGGPVTTCACACADLPLS